MRDDIEIESNPIKVRAAVHRDLRDYALKVFALRPELKSIMLAVAQYWADEADDAVHAYMVGSARDVPKWPHDCPEGSDGEPIHGEECEYCREEFEWMPFDDNGSAIVGFAAYCHGEGSQEEPQDQNYLPYAIVHRPDEDEEPRIEIVGHVLRGYDEIPDDTNDATHPPATLDARARELFDLACASPTDDGPRRVLADYLLEHDDPRGEYISLALADDLDDEAIARRDALLAEYAFSWMYPLVSVATPAPLSRFERGLLTHVEIYTRDFEAIAKVAGSPVWRSVESITILPDSYDLVDPEMIALRRLGPIGTQGLQALADHTWNIEELAVGLDDSADWSRLVALNTLPRLRALTISGRHLPTPYYPAFDTESELVTAPWWPQLRKLTVLAPSDYYESLFPWLSSSGDHCSFAIAELGHHGGPAGWELTFERPQRSIEVRMPAFSASGRRARLRELLDHAAAPDGAVVLIGGPCWQPTDDDVDALARSGRRVTIESST